jgi:hypothetical protein
MAEIRAFAPADSRELDEAWPPRLPFHYGTVRSFFRETVFNGPERFF